MLVIRANLPFLIDSASSYVASSIGSCSLVVIMQPLFVTVHAVTFSTCRITSEGSRIFAVLDDIIDHTLRNLHIVQKNLLFWQSTAEVSIKKCLLYGGGS